MAQPTDRLRAMDEQGIDVEALSINPFWYTADRDVARKLIAVQNEKLAEVCAAMPDRFVAFATVALQHTDLAVEQLAEGIKTYGCAGCRPAGASRGPPVPPLLGQGSRHPQGTAELETSGRLEGNGVLTNTIGNPVVTTIALSHLSFEGTLARFPGQKIRAGHGGLPVWEHPGVTREDILACIAYGSEMSRERYVDIPTAKLG